MIRRFLYKIKKYIKRFPHRLINSLLLLKLKPDSYIFVNMSTHWSGLSLKKHNFGDDLNVYLIEELTHKKVLKYDEFLHFKKRNILCIGSIVEYLCDNNSIIWGAGALFGDQRLHCIPKQVLATRGPKTQLLFQLSGVECPSIFGDPALLLPIVYNPKIEKKNKVGIIPHYKDLGNAVLKNFIEHNNNCIIIDFQNYSSWKSVIDEIVSCQIIASSSLHGLIVSDAYGIPNVRIIFSDKIAGGDFKYYDYFDGVCRKSYKAIDCTKKIDLCEIIENAKNYQAINFDSSQLLKTCPFPLAPQYRSLVKRN